MARRWIPPTSLIVVLLLGSGLVPGGTSAAGQASPTARTAAPFPSASRANARWVDYVGHAGGPTRAVAVEGNLAYVGEGPSLTVLDISVPGSPTVLGKTELLPDMVHGIAVVGGYAYVADHTAGLRVVDVSTPSAPVEVGFCDTPGSAWGVAVAGGYAYVADYRAGLRVVDVSKPAAPMLVGFFDTPGTAMDVDVGEGVVYVADYDGGLLLLHFTPTSRFNLPLVRR